MLLEVARHALGLVLALGVDHGDVAPLCGERMADALAKPAIAAGNDGNRPLQVHYVSSKFDCPTVKPVVAGGNRRLIQERQEAKRADPRTPPRGPQLPGFAAPIRER